MVGPREIWATVNGARSVFPGGETYRIGGWEEQPREWAQRYIRADEYDALMDALHDAIVRPKGVVPGSAERFYNPHRADDAERVRTTP